MRSLVDGIQPMSACTSAAQPLNGEGVEGELSMDVAPYTLDKAAILYNCALSPLLSPSIESLLRLSQEEK